MSLNDADYVRRQYAGEQHLATRRSVWQPGADGRDPATSAVGVIATEVAAGGRRVLEVGCGAGIFADRLVREVPGVDLTATDQSARFVELTAALTEGHGVATREADLEHLPFEDASYDVVAALWMLYHLPDLHRGLAEIERVLRPGGLLVAVTNGDEHVALLRREAGGLPEVTQFSRENGEAALARHFDDVRREDFSGRAVFPDHAAAMAYLTSSQEDVAWDLPWFDGPREYAGASSLFTARRR